MAAAGHQFNPMSFIHADAPINSHNPKGMAELVEEIDVLRKAMTDTFMQEHSLVADSVVELSRKLDLKINEYMKQAFLSREEVR